MAVWILTTGNVIPQGALRGGYEANGQPLFIARANIQGYLTPGKAGYHLPGGHFPFGGKEEIVNQYEVLIHPTQAPGFYDWKRCSNGNVPPNAYMVDRETYIGRYEFAGALIPGKVHTSHRCAYIPYGGKEQSSKDYEVLCQIK